MRLSRLFPFLGWRQRVNRGTLRADALAGLVGAAIVLPQAVAFATLAGMPPQYGLYAAIVPAIVAALFGSSWHLVSGPTNVISIFVFASLSPLVEPGGEEYIRLVLTLTLLTGLMQLAMGLARMGALVNFISHTVVVSFTAGAACLIVAAQLGNFFGIALERGASFSRTLTDFLLHLNGINPYVTAVGVLTLLTGIAIPRFWPKFPYMIGAMLAGSGFALALDALFGPETTRIATIGALTGMLPALSVPDLSPNAIRDTLPVALAVTILALTEAVSIARAIAIKSGQRIDANQEFIGQGLSNVCGSFFSAYASSGSFNRSGANYDAGAHTPLAAVFAALFLIAILFALGQFVAYLPLAVMGAILFLVAYGLFDLHHIRNIVRASRRETAVMLLTFMAAIFADLEFAIYAGVLLSLMLYLTRTSHPMVLDVKPDPAPDSYHFTADSSLPDCPQLKMLRVNGSIFFGAVDHVRGHLETVDELNPGQKHVLIVASGINFVDIAGAEMLAQEARRRQRLGGGLYFYRLKDAARAVLARGGYLEQIGADNIFPVKTRAVAAIYPKLDSGICRQCQVRIFRECHQALPDGQPVSPLRVADR
ncbi:MAG: sodium-independent anion transporter [Betaproteobacteria bacterium RIFCSPLOWO2_02_64_14]|nr:MAG: sodium-independent anion transporter [Betaproteobacteria bacterium RIFCSPLOWO2_02_64_14]